MNELVKINETIFESIKHVDDDGNEYWYARELHAKGFRVYRMEKICWCNKKSNKLLQSQ